MPSHAFRRAMRLGLAAACLLVLEPAVHAAEPTAAVKVVIQVSDADPAKWNLALNNAANARKELGERLSAEIVAFGPGIDMLKFDAPVAERVQQAMAAGIKVVACQNTMAARKLSKDDMQSGIGYVPAGVVEII